MESYICTRFFFIKKILMFCVLVNAFDCKLKISEAKTRSLVEWVKLSMIIKFLCTFCTLCVTNTNQINFSVKS